MASSLLDLLHALHRDGIRVRREQRAARAAKYGEPDWAERQRRQGRKVPPEHRGIPEYTMAIGINGGRSSAISAEHSNGEW